ncbi:MAG: siroheme synthase [Rhodospirillaceae bacterium]|nr:siroheme synthase [Rhodospirillaceae bacterium]
MIPVALDPRAVRTILVGNGPATVRRLEWLAAGGETGCAVFSPSPSEALVAAAGDRLRHRLPDDGELADAQFVWIVDLPETEAGELAAAARRWDALVNVEDVPGDCDFHNPAVVRRGDLLVGISTGGRCPGLASLLRRRIESALGPEWEERLRVLDARRRLWRKQGHGFSAIAEQIEAYVESRGWLDGLGLRRDGEAVASPTAPHPSPPMGRRGGIDATPILSLSAPLGGRGPG